MRKRDRLNAIARRRGEDRRRLDDVSTRLTSGESTRQEAAQ